MVTHPATTIVIAKPATSGRTNPPLKRTPAALPPPSACQPGRTGWGRIRLPVGLLASSQGSWTGAPVTRTSAAADSARTDGCNGHHRPAPRSSDSPCSPGTQSPKNVPTDVLTGTCVGMVSSAHMALSKLYTFFYEVRFPKSTYPLPPNLVEPYLATVIGLGPDLCFPDGTDNW